MAERLLGLLIEVLENIAYYLTPNAKIMVRLVYKTLLVVTVKSFGEDYLRELCCFLP